MKPAQFISFTLMLAVLITNSYAQQISLLIGTGTKPGKSEGLYVYQFDLASGKAVYQNKTTAISNPLYIAASKNEQTVYAVNNVAGKGTVSAFRFDKNTGSLSLLNQKQSKGVEPCFVTIDDKSKHVFVANYNGGSFAVLPVLKDGSLQDAVQSIKYMPTGTARPQQMHVHCTYLSPDQRNVFISDLGNDRIVSYRYLPNASMPLDTSSSKITALPKGSGPRLFEFHPNKKFAYSIQEISSEIIVFAYRKDSLAILQSISSLEPGFTGRKWPAEVHISPDGKFLYASNRDSANEIAIFAIQPDGKLVAAGRQSTMGKTPRSFAIDPTGNYLLAANQASDAIVVFKRDKKTGQLTNTGHSIELGSPACLKFMAAK